MVMLGTATMKTHMRVMSDEHDGDDRYDADGSTCGQQDD